VPEAWKREHAATAPASAMAVSAPAEKTGGKNPVHVRRPAKSPRGSRSSSIPVRSRARSHEAQEPFGAIGLDAGIAMMICRAGNETALGQSPAEPFQAQGRSSRPPYSNAHAIAAVRLVQRAPRAGEPQANHDAQGHHQATPVRRHRQMPDTTRLKSMAAGRRHPSFAARCLPIGLREIRAASNTAFIEALCENRLTSRHRDISLAPTRWSILRCCDWVRAAGNCPPRIGQCDSGYFAHRPFRARHSRRSSPIAAISRCGYAP
jgi:hypothetical protein